VNQTKITSGRKGEQSAADFLQKKGYVIIEKNFRIRNGEIDIIAIDKKENTLVFVEVKTRSSEQFGTPFEAIHYWKMKALLNAAQVYKLSHKNLPDLMRIDAIAISINKNGEVIDIEHMKNISG
jgi:putative endonuclease